MMKEKNFWQDLKKPIISLAPMEDVTDTVFRRVILECGRPDAFFTEFTNVEGMQSDGQEKVIKRLKYTEVERPLVAQVWGIIPEDYFKTAQLILELGFDGIDINMGCPVKNVIKKGACSALIQNPNLAKEIVLATKEGVKNKIPVSVKTRIGFNKIVTEEWLEFILKETKPAVLTVHGRTTKEQSKVPNHWGEIAKVPTLRDKFSPSTLIFGNGDVMSKKEAFEKAEKYNLDGIMIGRGVFYNPWIFDEKINPEEKIVKERLAILQKHVHLYEETWGQTKDFSILKRFFKIYAQGFHGASDLRVKLMACSSGEEVRKLITDFLN